MPKITRLFCVITPLPVYLTVNIEWWEGEYYVRTANAICSSNATCSLQSTQLHVVFKAIAIARKIAMNLCNCTRNAILGT